MRGSVTCVLLFEPNLRAKQGLKIAFLDLGTSSKLSNISISLLVHVVLDAATLSASSRFS